MGGAPGPGKAQFRQGRRSDTVGAPDAEREEGAASHRGEFMSGNAGGTLTAARYHFATYAEKCVAKSFIVASGFIKNFAKARMSGGRMKPSSVRVIAVPAPSLESS